MGEPYVGMSFGTYESKLKELSQYRFRDSSRIESTKNGTYERTELDFYSNRYFPAGYADKKVKMTPGNKTTAYAAIQINREIDKDCKFYFRYRGVRHDYPTSSGTVKVPNFKDPCSYSSDTDIKFSVIYGHKTAAVDFNGDGIVNEGEIMPEDKVPKEYLEIDQNLWPDFKFY